ncbi:MAG: MFS transporter [Anaerolineales bacterium]|nr:MFS transporter [Anaerolineales bacterium]
MTTLTLQQRTNFRLLYHDVFWWGLLGGSSLAFIPVYIARLEGTSFQVSLLTAGPAVLALFLSLPVGRWLENQDWTRTTFWTAFWGRIGYLLLIPMPWLFSDQGQVWFIILLTLVMSVPITILTVSFNAMFAAAVPPEWRPHVVGRRAALLAVSISVTSLICGQILDRVVFPLNYQIVFLIGVIGGGLSTFALGRMQSTAPESIRINSARAGRPLNDSAHLGQYNVGDAVRRTFGLRYLTRTEGKSLLRLDLLRGPYGPFMAAFFLFFTFLYLPIPLFPLFYVEDLNLTDGIISIAGALTQLTIFLVSLRLTRISNWLGNRKLMAAGAMLYGVFPFLMALAKGAPMFLVASLIGGGIWGLVNGGMINRLMERVPEDDRPAHMALYNLGSQLGILLGSLAGPLVGDLLGLRTALLVSAALRLLAGILFNLWDKDTPVTSISAEASFSSD